MSKCAARVLIIMLAFAAAAALSVSYAQPGDDEPERPLAVSSYPPEELDDPPATTLPRDDEGARSAGQRLAIGSYVSVQVNVDELGQNIVGDAANEPSIAVNSVNPNNMVIGWRQFDTISSNFRQGGWSYTMDAGQSWTFPGVLTPGTFRSDPVLDTDSDGNFYYQSLKETFFMDVFKSTDGGVTWGPPVASWGGDKNWMVIDKSSSIGNGHIYGIWREPFSCCGANVFTRSSNGGSSYEPPVPVERSPGLGTMAVGPEGEVYLTGIDEMNGGLQSFVAVRSLDARNPDDPTPSFIDEDVFMGGSLIFGGPPNPGGLIGQANIAVDHSYSLTRGFVYLLSTVNPTSAFGNQPAAVHIRRSEDGGHLWFPPIVVNDDLEVWNAWHWMAVHSVSPTGRLDVVWNDTRDSLVDTLSRLYYSYSYDQGRTWAPNVAVSPEFNSTVGWPNQSKIGDYYTIISDMAAGHVAYSATFNGEQDVYYVRVFPDCNENGVSDIEDIEDASADCNGNFIPDECEESTVCYHAGTVPTGEDEDDVPLLIGKTAGAEIALSWGASCKVSDGDYAVYEGGLGGEFDTHSAKVCGTGTDTNTLVLANPGDRYFLIVPLSIEHEGSYGQDSEGVERPTGAPDCGLSQLIGECLGSGGGPGGGLGN